MKDTQKFILNPEFKLEKFDNEILLYAVSSSKGVYLNETAHLVWGMCGKNYSVAEIIDLLEEAFPDHKASIHGDVVAAIESLVDDNVLIAADE